jgi:hypothetical protein
VVPIAAGVVLRYVGFRVPFAISCAAAIVTVFVTMRLDPMKQRSAARVALDEGISAAAAAAAAGTATSAAALQATLAVGTMAEEAEIGPAMGDPAD